MGAGLTASPKPEKRTHCGAGVVVLHGMVPVSQLPGNSKFVLQRSASLCSGAREECRVGGVNGGHGRAKKCGGGLGETRKEGDVGGLTV